MKIHIQPSFLSGTIQSNASKSSMQRACAAALVAKGASVIKNPGHSNDDKAALNIIQRLGARVQYKEESIEITSSGVQPLFSDISCGESGLSIRMFTPLVALSKKQITINGTGSLVTRPMNFFDEMLPLLGVSIQTNNGKLPLVIKGPVTPANIEVDGSLSSQFLTGLLFAYAACEASNVSIRVKNLKSKPYIDLTLDVMKHFGLKIPVNKSYEEFLFDSTVVLSNTAQTRYYTVEGDWSGAAFLLVAGAVSGNIIVKGLDVFSTQADTSILQALMDSGCTISVKPEQIEISTAPLKPFHFDATECPDLFPPLVALAAYCNGISVIEGTDRLLHKESNRALTLKQEFGKMGLPIDLQDDKMIIHGGAGINGAAVHSHHDHRIAMACAVAALGASGTTVIEDAEAVNKSYPDFYEHLKMLGAVIEIYDSIVETK